jgi:hypothetical protein
MNETPHPAVLDPEAAIAVVEEHFSSQTALLRDLANYGSSLVIRAFNSSPKKMTEAIVVGVHLKQIVAMVDAVEVLLSAGCGHAAFLPARTAFEASVYADWIMESDSERRATRYLVANYRDERLWATRAIPGTTEEKAMSQVTAMLGFNVHSNHPGLAVDGAKHLADVNRILSQPSLKPIDKEFDVARGKRKRDPEWYELDGLLSIRHVADKVGRLPEYTFFYSKGSQVTHTGSFKDQIRFKSGEIRFLPIRHVEDAKMLINFVCASAFATYRKVLERYRPGELSAFGRKYLEDWQEPFLNIKDVKSNF